MLTREIWARLLLKAFIVIAFAAGTQIIAYAQGRPKITVLYDNTAHRQECSADWGFACLIEGMEKTILFDTGTKGEVLLSNARSLGVDLSKTGAVVISHAHQDHTGGLNAVLPKMPGVPVWLPHSSPSALRDTVRQAGGVVFSSEASRSICRDATLTGELGEQIKEQALILRTTRGLVVVTGCSHPGIVPILEKAREIGMQRICAVIGGFHLLQHPEAAVAEILARFKGLEVARVGATHCTGAKQIEQFRQAYGADFIEMGAGRVVTFD
jgi:7,8-dihydropterin-6-yl-methyl-4-(beta-D-ribofuranosyl)aminobenzene 5'-phosphate synthase